jgi:hypothetical protein
VCGFDSFDSVGADLLTHDTVPSRQYHFHEQIWLCIFVGSLLQAMILATKWVHSFQLFSLSPYICAPCVDPCEKYNGTQQACEHPHQIVETSFTQN